MKVFVWVRDKSIEINVGPGNQRLKWLALVAVQRYEAESCSIFAQKHVPTGIMDALGTPLSPNKSVRVALNDGDSVYVLLQADDDVSQQARTAKGTSKFVMTQGAAPSECLLDGHGIGYALAGHSAFLYLTARDTYANLARNGGGAFTVSVTELLDGPVHDHAAGLKLPDEEEATAGIVDQGNGTYIVSYYLPKKGKFKISILLDGEPIARSPLRTVAVKTHVPAMIKWLTPRVVGDAPKFENAVTCCSGRDMYVFGGSNGSTRDPLYSDQLHILNVERMKWEVPKVSGKPPQGRAGAAHVLTAARLLVYGGESDGGPSAPLDSLHALEMGALSWSRIPNRGVQPGPLAHAAMTAIGSRVYMFGGWTGEELTNRLYLLDITSMIWDLFEENGNSPPPEPRMMHTMVAVGKELIVYGGKAADGKNALRDLAIYDTATELWSYPNCRGDAPGGRWGHSALMWGRNLLIALGADNDRESVGVNMLNLDTFVWDAWDGNVARVGQALHLIEGKLFLTGGKESITAESAQSDTLQLNMGGFMIELDGVDDEIMIPHLPTIIPTAYTIEAWIRPAKVAPMNIICRTDETYPMSAWSHQLRINARGNIEHYCEADDKYTVFNTTPVTAGTWYHVAGVAQGGGEMKLLVNGKEEGQPVEIGPLRQGLDRYFVGSASGDGMGMFEGTIAEVRLFNYALGEDEVHEHMRKVLNGTERGIVGYWRMNEGPGGMIFDHSSYGNVGPIKGDPQWTASTVPIAVD